MRKNSVNLFLVAVSQVIIAFIAADDFGNINEECLAETVTITSNSDVVGSTPYTECFISLENGEDECSADFSLISVSYKEACFNANGRYITQDVAFNCLTISNSVTYNVTYNFLSFPGCLGTSCLDSDVNTYYNTVLYPFLGDRFETQGFSNCQVTGTNRLTEDVPPVTPIASTPTAVAVPPINAPVPAPTTTIVTVAPVLANAPILSTLAPSTDLPTQNFGNLSGQCLAESINLSNNPNIWGTDPYSSVVCYLTLPAEDVCTVSHNLVNGPFKDACFAANGQFRTIDLTHNCLDLYSSSTYNVTYNFISYPDCLGASCTDADLNEYYSTVVLPYLDDEFEKQGFTNCQTTSSNIKTFDAPNTAPFVSTPTINGPEPTPTISAITSAPVAVADTAPTAPPDTVAPIFVVPVGGTAPVEAPTPVNDPSPLSTGEKTPRLSAPTTTSTSNAEGILVYNIGIGQLLIMVMIGAVIN